jgi:hypothetical protein
MASSGGTYQEVHYSRDVGGSGLCGACGCSIVGLFLYFGALAGIAMNEVGTVCVSKALEFARQTYDVVDCNYHPKDKEPDYFRGELAYFSCPLGESSLEKFTPHNFKGARWLDGAFEEKAVKMRQEVSMYQCIEHKHEKTEKVSDKETRTVVTWEYRLEWSGSEVNSNNFKAWDNNEALRALERGCGRNFKRNPPMDMMQSETLSSGFMVAGGFDLTRLLDKVSVKEPVTIKQHPSGSYSAPLTTGNSKRLARDGQAYTRREFIEYYGEEQGVKAWETARPEGGGKAKVGLNTVQTCVQPEVGCLKLAYFKSSIRHISHMAKLDAWLSLTKPWRAPSSWMCSSSSGSNSVDLFEEYAVSADELVDSAQSSNTAMTWLFRLCGFIAVVVGVYCFLQPIQAVADMVDKFLDWFKFIPILGWGLDFLGDVVSGAVGFAIVLISFGIGAPSAIAVLSVSWLVMRPVIGVPMLLGSFMFFAWTVKQMLNYAVIGKTKRQKQA